jgi:hypothetical protein
MRFLAIARAASGAIITSLQPGKGFKTSALDFPSAQAKTCFVLIVISEHPAAALS